MHFCPLFRDKWWVKAEKRKNTCSFPEQYNKQPGRNLLPFCTTVLPLPYECKREQVPPKCWPLPPHYRVPHRRVQYHSVTSVRTKYLTHSYSGVHQKHLMVLKQNILRQSGKILLTLAGTFHVHKNLNITLCRWPPWCSIQSCSHNGKCVITCCSISLEIPWIHSRIRCFKSSVLARYVHITNIGRISFMDITFDITPKEVVW